MTEGRVSRRRNPTIILHNSQCSFLLSSSTLVPDLIGDPSKEWIQSSKGSRAFAFSSALRREQHWIP